MGEALHAETNAHTPSTLMALFSSAFKLAPGQGILWLKGIYRDQRRGSYSGYFFDRLKDEMSGQIVTIKIPRQIKELLNDEGLYLFKGYLDKDVRPDGVVEPVFVVAELGSPVASSLPPGMMTRAGIVRQKEIAGRKDLNRMLRQKLGAGEHPCIALVYGQTSIVHQDVNSALKDARARYELVEHRTNLSDKGQIIQTLVQLNDERYDVVAVVRGGGAGLEIFDDVEIVQAALKLRPILVTAIGHAQDVTLLQQVADWPFTTPTALGAHLREMVQSVRVSRQWLERWPSVSVLFVVALALVMLILGLILGVVLGARII